MSDEILLAHRDGAVGPGGGRPARDHSAFPCLDGLRALAAFAVFLRHSNGMMFLQNSRYAPVSLLHWLDRLGFFGIGIFFVLSGFLLYRPYALAALRNERPPAWLPFWRRRCCRIFPAYWLALTVAVYGLGQDRFVSIGQAVNVFTLTQNYRSGYTRLGLGVAWTLVVEVSFYAVLPPLAWIIRAAANRADDPRVRLRVLLTAVALLGVGAIAFRFWFVGHNVAPTRAGSWFSVQLASHWLPTFFDWFALGMAMAIGSAWISTGGRSPRAIAWLGRHPSVLWWGALIGYGVVVRYVAYASDSRLDQSDILVRWVVTGVAAAAVVMPGVFGDQRAGTIRRLLRTRALVAGGVISYGIYLWHLPVWIQFTKWFPSGVPMLAQVATVFVVTLMLAAISWRFLERPIIRWAARR